MSKKNEQLKQLDFLLGDWVSESESNGTIIHRAISYRWVYGGNFLEAESERTIGDNTTRMTIDYLWDAVDERILSWVRASDGEWGRAVVEILGKTTIRLNSNGVNSAGNTTSLLSTLDQIDSNTRSEAWSEIKIDGKSVPSSTPIMWVRAS